MTLKSKSLLEEKDEETFSLLSDSSNENRKFEKSEDLESTIVIKVAQNGMKVIEIVQYNINDRERKAKNGIMAYSYNEIRVRSLSLNQKQGYLTINDGDIDIPIENIRRSTYPMYFYDKELAIKKVNGLNLDVLNAINEGIEELVTAKSFMDQVVEGKLN